MLSTHTLYVGACVNKVTAHIWSYVKHVYAMLGFTVKGTGQEAEHEAGAFEKKLRNHNTTSYGRRLSVYDERERESLKRKKKNRIEGKSFHVHAPSKLSFFDFPR